MKTIRDQLIPDDLPTGMYTHPDSDTPSTGDSEGQPQGHDISGEAEHIENVSDVASASDSPRLDNKQTNVEGVPVDAEDQANENDGLLQPAQVAGWDEFQLNNGWGEPQQDNGWDEPQEDNPRDLEKCPGCMDLVTEPLGVFIECGHSWHRECLNDNFHNALQSRNNWPAKCCSSSERIDHNSIQEYLDDYILQLLFARVEEFESPNPIFCSNLSCGEFIPDAVVDNGQTYWVNCPECQMTTCKLCKCPSLQHSMPGVCPTFLSAENEQLAEQEGWKVCPRPGCSTLIDRSEGCDTMECPACQTEFCYRCGCLLRDGIPCNCAGQNQWVEELGQFVRGGDDDGADADADNLSDSSSFEGPTGLGDGLGEIEVIEGIDPDATETTDADAATTWAWNSPQAGDWTAEEHVDSWW
jgi:IBR domain, a half RING-finger domain